MDEFIRNRIAPPRGASSRGGEGSSHTVTDIVTRRLEKAQEELIDRVVAQGWNPNHLILTYTQDDIFNGGRIQIYHWTGYLLGELWAEQKDEYIYDLCGIVFTDSGDASQE